MISGSKVVRTMLMTVIAAGLGCTQGKGCSEQRGPAESTKPPEKEETQQPVGEGLESLPEGVIPLSLRGDINEDWKVDTADLELLQHMASGKAAKGATCPAAGDLNWDLSVDEKDLARFQELLGGGKKLTGATLFFQPKLECGLEQVRLAAPLELAPDGTASVHLLDKELRGKVAAEVVKGKAEVGPLESGQGFLVKVSPDADPMSRVQIEFKLPDGMRVFYGLPGAPKEVRDRVLKRKEAEKQQKPDAGEPNPKDGGAEKEEDTDTTPPSEPPVEDASTPDCPQRGKGFATLMISFHRNENYSYLRKKDAKHLEELETSLKALGCEPKIISPAFSTLQELEIFVNEAGQRIELTEDQLKERNYKIEEVNRAEWERLYTEIDTFRTSAVGKEFIFVMIRAHGSRGWRSGDNACGTWGPGFQTGVMRRDVDDFSTRWEMYDKHDFYRAKFHFDNYTAFKRKVCGWYNGDLSCYAGRTPEAIDQLENKEVGGHKQLCDGAGSAVDHSRHAGYEFVAARGTSPAGTTCRGADTNPRFKKIREAAKGATSMSGFLRGLVDALPDPPVDAGPTAHSYYKDKGYHDCDLDSHPSAGYPPAGN